MTAKRLPCFLGMLLATAGLFPVLAVITSSGTALAQVAAASPVARQVGTVKTVSGTGLTIATDAGEMNTVAVANGARILQLAPGSTDLKAAQTIALTDIEVGDRVLVTGHAGDATGTFNASRVILMKSGDIEQKHATEQADWQKRGMGGLVIAVDPGAGTLTLSAGARKVRVKTAEKTIFRRYAGDSIKFQDAKLGTLAQIQPGDQVEVRGDKSDDGTSVKAEEVVSGSFRNVSGMLATVDPASGSVTFKDLTTKKTMTVGITANSDLRKLPPEMAARFAARQRGGSAGAPTGGTGAGARPASATGSAPRSAEAGAEREQENHEQEGGHSAGMDLSKMLARLPSVTLADLHPGEAVMVVASESQSGSDKLTAVTLLSGVEPILAATSSGSQAMTLSPWNVGGGAPEGGGTPQ